MPCTNAEFTAALGKAIRRPTVSLDGSVGGWFGWVCDLSGCVLGEQFELMVCYEGQTKKRLVHTAMAAIRSVGRWFQYGDVTSQVSFLQEGRVFLAPFLAGGFALNYSNALVCCAIRFLFSGLVGAIICLQLGSAAACHLLSR
ncbi:unnamed protein product [Phaeothamnion confervicola]